MHTFVFITNCIGDPACITYNFMMKLLVALIALVVIGFCVLVVVCGVWFSSSVLGAWAGFFISAGCTVRCVGVSDVTCLWTIRDN